MISPRDPLGRLLPTHGMCTTREYKNWFSMKARCGDPKNRAYRWYGGRGIAVCRAWQDSFETFLRDVGPRPSRRHTLDRIDNDRGYEPGNVRWATRPAQMRNTRVNRWLEWNGQRMVLEDWAGQVGVTRATLIYRLAHWSLDDALTVGPNQRRPPRCRRGGHLFTAANTYTPADGQRRCLTCKQERDRHRLHRSA